MLVLDKSGSMMAWWDHDDNDATSSVRRWRSLHQVVSDLLGRLHDRIDFGAQLFPALGSQTGPPDLGCSLSPEPEVPIAASNRSAILASMPAADAVFYGGTPTRDALANARAALLQLDARRPRAMVLVTDGAANCAPGTTSAERFSQPDDGLPQWVQDTRDSDGISTYVIGIDIVDEVGIDPTINPHEHLSAVAIAGGAPQLGPEPFYNARNQPELEAALEAVAASIECSVDLGQSVELAEQVSVELAGIDQPHVSDCSTQSGWAFTSSSAPFDQLQLCGDACSGDTVHIEVSCVD